MRRTLRILAALALVVWPVTMLTHSQQPPAPAPVPAPAPAVAPAGDVTVAEMTGSVDVRPKADQPWGPGAVGMKLGPDWEVSTGMQGQALLRFADKSEVLVRRLTQMKISDFSKAGDVTKTKIEMKYGDLRAQVKKGTAPQDFQVKATTYTLSVGGTEIQEISYYKGQGGMVRMGVEGKSNVHVNPTLSLYADESTDDQLTDPLWFAKMDSWTPLGFPGWTFEELYSTAWHDGSGTQTGPGVGSNLNANNPANANTTGQLLGGSSHPSFDCGSYDCGSQGYSSYGRSKGRPSAPLGN